RAGGERFPIQEVRCQGWRNLGGATGRRPAGKEEAMATDPQFLQYVLEQAGLGAALAARRMFGEYGFYLDGRFVAVAADNQLLLKPTAEARALLPDASEAPPYPG